jgi:hypothetical protein
MKRTRKFLKHKVRFYMCGEYGPKEGRPHYHACLFNADFRDGRQPVGKSGSGHTFYEQADLTRLWGLGFATVQDLVPETASYCARYIMKKALGEEAKTAYIDCDDDGVITQLKPEYAAMSLKPGIGARWFERYQRDVFPHDFVIHDGTERQVPKYYDRLAKRALIQSTSGLVDPQSIVDATASYDKTQHGRQIRAAAAAPDNTDARRQVREAVHVARVCSLTRDLDK